MCVFDAFRYRTVRSLLELVQALAPCFGLVECCSDARSACGGVFRSWARPAVAAEVFTLWAAVGEAKLGHVCLLDT